MGVTDTALGELPLHFDIPDEVWSGGINFLSTLLGAAIGWVASTSVYKSQLKDQMQTSAFSSLVYVQSAYSYLVEVKRHIVESLESSRISTDQLWQKVTPIIGTHNRISLANGDLVFFARAKEYPLMLDILTLSMRFSAIAEAMSTYGILRTELLRELGNETVEGEILSGTLTPEQYKRLYPRMVELNSLLDSTLKSVEVDLPFARDVFDRIGPAGKRYFGRKNFPHVKATA